MKNLHTVSFALLIIGGLNWLLAAFNKDIASWNLLPDSVVMIIYVLVGLAAIYEVVTHKGRCKDCQAGGSM